MLGCAPHVKDVNLVFADLNELCIFFGQHYTLEKVELTQSELTEHLSTLNEREQDEFLHLYRKVSDIRTKCTEFVDERTKTKKITTTQLFNLIALARDHLFIDTANILDTSCNTVPNKTRKENDDCHGCSISVNGFTPEDGWAWGGKSRKSGRKTRRKTRRKAKR